MGAGRPCAFAPPDSMSSLTEGQRLGAYRIVRLLGQGGMGAVYEARQEPLDRRVALKTLHAEFARNAEVVTRFFNEAKVLSQLEHPSIVQASDFGHAADGTAYLVMEYLRGQSLGRRLAELAERGERLPTVTALQIAFQVADVLTTAHAQGIVHRDIKPDNLMLVSDVVAPGGERVKLLDFGIAKLTAAKDRGSVKTATQQVMGTPAYMSPEQCAGAGGVDAKTDVYALGCVLYEALAGRAPFVAEGAGELIGMHLYHTPPLLLSIAPNVPSEVAELVHRMLTKSKEQRPTMTQAAEDLAKLLSKLSSGSVVLRSRPHASADPAATRVQFAQAPSTTHGRSMGQLRSAALKSKRMLLGVGVIAVALGVFGAVRRGSPTEPGAAAIQRATPSPPQVAPMTATTPAGVGSVEGVPTPQAAVAVVSPKAAEVKPAAVEEPATVLWSIDSSPAGSYVVDEEGQALGRTPLKLSRASQPGVLSVRIKKSGYLDGKLTLRRDHSESKQMTLSKVPAAAPPSKRIGYEE